MARISYLIPVRNAEDYLSETLESALAQTMDNFEVIAVDDQSSDRTLEILHDFAIRDQRIRIVEGPGMGISVALNQGLLHCKAPLVARLDADDLCLPLRLERQMAYLNSNPQVAVLGTSFRLISSAGEEGPVVHRPESPKEVARALPRRNPICHPTVMMRRDQIERVGGYRTSVRFAEDYDLWLRVARTNKLANLRTCLVKYRIHEDQASNIESQAVEALAIQGMNNLRSKEFVSRGLPSRIDPSLLLELGISDADIKSAQISFLARRLADYEAVGMTRAACAVRGSLGLEAARADLPWEKHLIEARLSFVDYQSARRRKDWLRAMNSLRRSLVAILRDTELRGRIFQRLLAGRLR